MSQAHFADALLEACTRKNSRLVVGLDPHPGMLPTHLIEKYRVDLISIGNGTASKESEIFVAETLKEIDRKVFTW
jgi:transcriptional accessory protein Tex/SPT6